MTFQLGEELRAARPGELVFVPPGAIHALANLSDRPARYVLICTPGQVTEYSERLNPRRTSPDADSGKPCPEIIVFGPREDLGHAA